MFIVSKPLMGLKLFFFSSSSSLGDREVLRNQLVAFSARN